MYLDYKNILQLIFPPSEDEQIIASVQEEDFVRLMTTRCISETNTLLQYNNTQVRSAIHLLKFHDHAHARRLLSAVLAKYLSETIPSEYIIIPVPLSKKRERQRGYNQVTNVIKDALRTPPLYLCEQQILVRKQHTTPQTSLSREARLTNVTNAFSITNQLTASKKLAGKHILLIDDVMTTGATLKAAKATLLPLNPASITCLALAH